MYANWVVDISSFFIGLLFQKQLSLYLQKQLSLYLQKQVSLYFD